MALEPAGANSDVVRLVGTVCLVTGASAIVLTAACVKISAHVCTVPTREHMTIDHQIQRVSRAEKAFSYVHAIVLFPRVAPILPRRRARPGPKVLESLLSSRDLTWPCVACSNSFCAGWRQQQGRQQPHQQQPSIAVDDGDGGGRRVTVIRAKNGKELMDVILSELGSSSVDDDTA